MICLNWIVEAQSRITNFRRQRVGYVLPADDKPRLFSLDGGFTNYEIDPERFRHALTLTLSQEEIGLSDGRGAPPLWPARPVV